MGLFGLGSFGEGLVKGLAESATVSLQDEIGRIEDSIKSASDIRIKRIVQDQDRRRDEAEKIVKALKRARANLGGVDSPEAAVRAASLLKKEGDLKSFNTLIDKISQRTDMDFDKYFGDVSKMSPAASDLDIAYSFIDETTIPLPSSEAGLEAVKPKGIMKYLGPDIDAEKLVEERTAEQMQMMDLGVRDIRKVAVPTIEFKEEAFNMDGMNAEEEFKYVNNKIAKGNLEPSKMKFYSDRAEQLANRLGFDEQFDIATEQLRVLRSAETPDAAAIATQEQKVFNLGKDKRRLDTLKTGSTIELLKLDKEMALEEGRLEDASAISNKLFEAGAISMETYTSELNVKAMQGDEAARQQLVKLGTFNAKLKQQIGDASKRVTIDGMNSVDESVIKKAMRRLSNDASLMAKGIQFKPDAYGQKTLDQASIIDDESKQKAFNAALADEVNRIYEEYANNDDIAKDVNFIAAYEAHKDNIDLSAKPEAPVAFVPSEAQINTAKLPKYDDPAAFADVIKQNSTQNNTPINIDNIIATAEAAGRDEDYIKNLRVALGTSEPAPEPVPEPQPDPAAAERNAAVDAIVDRFHNPVFSPTLIGQPSKVNRLIREELGMENTPENRQFVEQLMEESAARFARQHELENEKQAERVRQSAKGRPRLGMMSRDPSKLRQRIQ